MPKNPLWKKGFVVGIIVLFVGTSIIPTIAQDIGKSSLPTPRGNWLYVGGSGPGNYTTIQGAINAASDGDNVFVYDDSSPYYEHVVINKSITLIGENRDTTIIDSSKNISVTADFVTISRFTILNREEGISLLGSYNGSPRYYITISNNIIKNSGVGIFLKYAIACNIFNNTITTCSYYGIFLKLASNCNIFNNIITTCSYYGILILGDYGFSTGNNIYGNRIINNARSGIVISPESFPSSVSDMWTGFSEYTTISYNDISNNGYANPNWGGGIWIDSSFYNNIFKNNITHNTKGVFLDAAFLTSVDDNTIYQNNIMNNTYGVMISADGRFSHARRNKIYQNNFIGNTYQARSQGGYNIWDNGSVGNYWEHYFEWDFNHDGIGGRPYRISLFNKDHHPLMRPYPDIL